eukprot:1189253-Prorocentrum_minimum.AAC.1
MLEKRRSIFPHQVLLEVPSVCAEPYDTRLGPDTDTVEFMAVGGPDTDTVELAVKTLSSHHIITGEFNSPANSLRMCPYVSVLPPRFPPPRLVWTFVPLMYCTTTQDFQLDNNL